MIKAIRTFLVVVDKQSFSEASIELDIVVSAISRQVSDLEKHYDCQLLYRTTRAMHLTAQGQFFVNQFKDILRQLDSLEDSVNVRRKKVAGELRVTSPDNTEGLGLHLQLSRFMQLYPDVRIIWRQLNRYVNLVDEGVDLAIRAGQLSDSNLVARKYTQFEIEFVASPAFLAEHGTPTHPDQLGDYKSIIELSSIQPRRWRYFDNNKECYVTVAGQIEVNQAKLVARFAASGDGIAQLPKFMVQSFLDSGQLVPILTDFQPPPLPVSLVYPPNRLVNPALQALVNFLLDNAFED